MLQTGGKSHIVDDATIIEAKGIAESWGVPVCHTGAAGLAGLLQSQRAGGGGGDGGSEAGQAGQQAPPSLVILSGLDRTMSSEAAADLRLLAGGR